MIEDMKRKVKMQLVGITMTLSCIVLIAGCNEQDDNPTIIDSGVIELVSFSNSGCKSFSRTRNVPDEDDMQESAIIKAGEGGKLYIEHNNAMFNCGIRNLLGFVESVEGNTIKLSYKYDILEMDCMCPFDMSYIIDGLIEGENYSLYMINSHGEEKLIQFIYNLQFDENVKL
jgi:hypothetical protein